MRDVVDCLPKPQLIKCAAYALPPNLWNHTHWILNLFPQRWIHGQTIGGYNCAASLSYVDVEVSVHPSQPGTSKSGVGYCTHCSGVTIGVSYAESRYNPEGLNCFLAAANGESAGGSTDKTAAIGGPVCI
jgi:hypothetical protein